MEKVKNDKIFPMTFIAFLSESSFVADIQICFQPGNNKNEGKFNISARKQLGSSRQTNSSL